MGIELKDIEKIYLLFKWINPAATEAIQLWENGKTPIVNDYYKIQSGRSIVSVFFIIENMSEANFKKLYKKKDLLPHLDFIIIYSNGVHKIGWKLRKQQL